MDWLLHNPIANLDGPQFLLLYAVVAVVVLVLCRLLVRGRDHTAALLPPGVPTQPDPYELAYLHDGPREVMQAIIFSLIQRGYLLMQQTQNKRLLSSTSFQWVERAPVPMNAVMALQSIERYVFGLFSPAGTTPASSLAGWVMPAEVRTPSASFNAYCKVYEQRLQAEHLLTEPAMKRAGWQTWLLGAVILGGLAAYRLILAAIKGHNNGAFLYIMAAVALLVLIRVCAPPRVSKRGNAYLKQLRLAFEPLKQHTLTPAALVSPAAPLLVGVFGVGVLAASPYSAIPTLFQTRDSGGSSCSSGGSCGGGGGCGGGGCGG